MASQFVILSSQKPKYGEPCNGCGYCCQNEVCPPGKELIQDNEEAPCRALEWNGHEYRCGLMLHPSKYMLEFSLLLDPVLIDQNAIPFIKGMLAAGKGCDAT